MADRVLIMGAGGRDFHVFNTCYRDAGEHVVVAFTAAQIPHIDRRIYPGVLAGTLYPKGIPILPESELEQHIGRLHVDEVVFAYSDVSYGFIESIEQRVTQAGARFSTFDPEATMLRGRRTCVAVCAVRTGCGKSPFSRFVVSRLRAMGCTPVVIRHPMPYGNLAHQVVQRFGDVSDFTKEHCTVEEMEEYEPHVVHGSVVFAGADYRKVLEAAEAEGDVVVWDGGNNDAPFVRPDLLFTLVDPLRPGHELDWFPGRWNLDHPDVVVIAKIDEAKPEDVETVRTNARKANPRAMILEGHSPIAIADEDLVRGRRVLVVEDGPTLTHGGMAYGAGFLAARRAGAAEIVDPRPYAQGEIAEAFATYRHLHDVLPALGYGEHEVADLQATIARVPCDAVVIGTPIDLSRIVHIEQPFTRVTYEFREGRPGSIDALLRRHLGVEAC